MEVSVVGRAVSYLDERGKLVTEKFEDYTRRNILRLFGSEADFVELWNGPEERRAILARLEAEGVFVDQLRAALGEPDADEFDLICGIAYGRPPMTRQMRANRVRQGKFLEKYQGLARQVLDELLQVYARLGASELDDMAVLQNEPLKRHGPARVVRAFGGNPGYRKAVRDMQRALYAGAANL